jgi:hypothetical protein
MNRLVILAVAAALPLLDPQATSAEAGPKTRIDNSLSACVRLTPGDTSSQKNLLLLSARIEVLKSIGECGCRSGAIRYRAYETYQGRQREMNRGLLNSIPRVAKPDDVIFVLNPDVLVRRSPPFAIGIACDDGA